MGDEKHILQNVFSYYRMCSLTIECVLYAQYRMGDEIHTLGAHLLGERLYLRKWACGHAYSECVLYRMCSVYTMFSTECVLYTVFSTECVLYTRCSLQNVFCILCSLQNVFCIHGVLYRMCSVQNASSRE